MALTYSSDSKLIKRKIADGILLNFLLRFKSIIYMPLLVILLPKEDIGKISLVQSYAALFGGFLLLHLPDAINKYLIGESEELQSERISFVITFCILFSLVGLLVLYFALKVLNDYTALFVILILISSFARVISKLSVFVFEVFQKTKLLMFNTLATEYLILGVLVAVWQLKFGLSYQLIIISQFIIITSFSLYFFYKLFKTIHFSFDFQVRKNFKILRTALILFPTSYAALVIQNSDYLLVEKYFGSSVLADYSFAYSISALVLGLSAAINYFWYSFIVSISQDDERITKICKKLLYIFCAATVFILLFFYFATPILISLINKQYFSSNKLVLILIPGFLINILIQMFSGILYAKHFEKQLLYAWLIGGILNIVLNLLFLKENGIAYAALTTTLSYCLVFFFLLISLYKKTSYKPLQKITGLFFFINIFVALFTYAFFKF